MSAMLTQADVDRTLAQLHQAGDAAARADGPLVSVTAQPGAGGHAVTTRLMLPAAHRLRAQLDEAIERAEARQAEIDAQYQDSAWEKEFAG